MIRKYMALLIAAAALAHSPVKCWAEPASATDTLIDRANNHTKTYLDRLADVMCTEQVEQYKLNPKGRAEYSENHAYDYFVILQGGADSLLLNESRTPKKNDRAGKRTIPLLLSNGFSMLFLVFHPYYRNSFRFEPGQELALEGQRYASVRFTHIIGTRTPVALAVRGRDYPLELTGEAWIDRNTGTIRRIEATLNSKMEDVGLRSFRSEVTYEPVPALHMDETYWFPSLATVELETLRQRWRNVHHFSQYKRFTVSTEETVADPRFTK